MMLFLYAAAKSASNHRSSCRMKIYNKTESWRKAFNSSKRKTRVPQYPKIAKIRLNNQ